MSSQRLTERETRELGGWTDIHEAAEKLAHHEDLQDEKRLIELPCAVGSKIYRAFNGEIIEWIITECRIYEDEIVFYDDSENLVAFQDIGTYIFLTRSAAESALAERSVNG